MPNESFSGHRLRRLRQGRLVREAVTDVVLRPQDLIMPIFVTEAKEPRPVAAMTGISQLPVAEAVQEIRRLQDQGLDQFLVFGVTPEEKKDAVGSYAAQPEAPANRLLEQVRAADLKVLMYADLCFCEYTSHGHCGALAEDDRHGIVDNDRTLQMLGETAIVQAASGADFVAPSGMVDGQVGAIRSSLDATGYTHTAICSYSVKFASTFYGPFRDAGQGGMQFGDRQGYQMDYRRSREWQSELQADLAQGADVVMVKPAATYLDIVHQVRAACNVPVAAYHVSGEFAMLHAAAERGWVDLKDVALETTYAIKRAGADLIITYLAPQLLRWI